MEPWKGISQLISIAAGDFQNMGLKIIPFDHQQMMRSFDMLFVRHRGPEESALMLAMEQVAGSVPAISFSISTAPTITHEEFLWARETWKQHEHKIKWIKLLNF